MFACKVERKINNGFTTVEQQLLNNNILTSCLVWVITLLMTKFYNAYST